MDATREEVRRLLSEGQSLSETARRVGLSLTTVRRWARAGGWRTSAGGGQKAPGGVSSSDYPGLTPAQSLALQALLRGESCTAAAKAAGVCRQTLYQWRQETTFAATLQGELERAWEEQRERLDALRGRALDTISDLLERRDDTAARVALSVLDRTGLPATREIRQTGAPPANPELAGRPSADLRAELALLRGGRS